ncbi:MAG TPA: nuclear transport factor 2 family protein [Steroidobacteraceae bacterium]|nr:nuclear transport factor 2 family protein [Steroidobacteraceae bacterium]
MTANRSLVSCLALLCCSLPAAAADEDDAGWFRTTTQALVDAVTDGAPAIWDRVLDPDCVITNEDGVVMGKRKFLEDLKPLPAGFSGDIRVRDLTVRALGTAAVVHYWLDERENVFDQQLRTTYVETDIYRRSGDSWTMVAMQVTVVPRDLEPVPNASVGGWRDLLGEYRYGERATSRYRVFVRDGSLFGGSDPKSATRLIPLAPLVFYQQGSIHLMIFVRNRSGVVTEVRELHKYNEVRLKRVTSSRPS